MKRPQTTFSRRFVLPLWAGFIIGCASAPVPPAPAPLPRPVVSDLQHMRDALELGKLYATDKRYGEACQELKRGSDLATRVLGPAAGATAEEAREASFVRNRANVERAHVLTILAADTSRVPMERKSFLDEAKQALALVDDTSTDRYTLVLSDIESLRKDLDPVPSSSALDHGPNSGPAATPVIALPPEPAHVPSPIPVVPSTVVSAPPPCKNCKGSGASPQPAHHKSLTPRSPIRDEPVEKTKSTLASSKSKIPSAPPGPIVDPPPASAPGSCGPAPAGAPTLMLKNDKDGVGGTFSGKLAHGQSAAYAILVCSRGDLEAVVPQGFQIQGDDFSFTGSKNYPGGKFGLRWAARLSPGKLVKFRVIADKEQSSDDYKVRYYLYPR